MKILVQQWFEPYGAPKEVHSDVGRLEISPWSLESLCLLV